MMLHIDTATPTVFRATVLEHGEAPRCVVAINLEHLGPVAPQDLLGVFVRELNMALLTSEKR